MFQFRLRKSQIVCLQNKQVLTNLMNIIPVVIGLLMFSAHSSQQVQNPKSIFNLNIASSHINFSITPLTLKGKGNKLQFTRRTSLSQKNNNFKYAIFNLKKSFKKFNSFSYILHHNRVERIMSFNFNFNFRQKMQE